MRSKQILILSRYFEKRLMGKIVFGFIEHQSDSYLMLGETIVYERCRCPVFKFRRYITTFE